MSKGRSVFVVALAALVSLAFAGTASAAAEEEECPGVLGVPCEAERAAPPLLNVTLASFTGVPTLFTYAEPGYTEITSDTPGRDLTIQVRGEGKAWLYNENDRLGDGSVIFGWSCRHPGTVYSYVVSAGTEPGHILTRSGHFKGASRYRCALLFNIAVREHVAAIRQREAVERKHRREALERQRRFESNCRTVGGTPVTIQTREGPYIVCRSQTGGIVAV
jgi:hypothetical protein